VHLSEEDFALLKNSGAGVVYNPDSNMKLGSGAAPVARYLSLGIPVAFGTDGAASNNNLSIFGAMDIGTKLQKLANASNTAMVAEQALYAATLGGAKVLGLDQDVGSLEVGKEADIVLLDLQTPHMQPVNSLVSQLVYSAQGLEVDTVFVAGRMLLENKKHVGVDVNAIYERANIWRDRIQARLKEL
jgi:5-methylthioadenosine/S-adenosylhomocysteine deaminase